MSGSSYPQCRNSRSLNDCRLMATGGEQPGRLTNLAMPNAIAP